MSPLGHSMTLPIPKKSKEYFPQARHNLYIDDDREPASKPCLFRTFLVQTLCAVELANS